MPSRSRGDFASAASAPLMRLVFERPKGGRRPLLRSSADRPQAVAFVSADGGSAVSIVNTIQQAAARAGKRTQRTIGGRSHGQQSSAYNALIFLRKGTKLRSRTQRTQLRLPSWNGGGQEEIPPMSQRSTLQARDRRARRRLAERAGSLVGKRIIVSTLRCWTLCTIRRSGAVPMNCWRSRIARRWGQPRARRVHCVLPALGANHRADWRNGRENRRHRGGAPQPHLQVGLEEFIENPRELDDLEFSGATYD